MALQGSVKKMLETFSLLRGMRGSCCCGSWLQAPPVCTATPPRRAWADAMRDAARPVQVDKHTLENLGIQCKTRQIQRLIGLQLPMAPSGQEYLRKGGLVSQT